MEPLNSRGTSAVATTVLIIGVVLVALLIVPLVLHNRKPAPSKAVATTKCLSKQFAVGSSGDCVKDIQTMVDFMETDGLNQCPFAGGAELPVTEYYDSTTADQVKVVQTWLDCFDKQEGIDPPSSAPRVVTASTWTELCTYAYDYPLQNNATTSPYRAQSLAAGKDAGCNAIQ